MSELQVGGLALVTGARYNFANIGKIVELVRLMGDGDWAVKGEMLDHFGISAETREVHPSHLLPIRPEQDPLDVTHKEELHA